MFFIQLLNNILFLFLIIFIIIFIYYYFVSNFYHFRHCLLYELLLFLGPAFSWCQLVGVALARNEIIIIINYQRSLGSRSRRRRRMRQVETAAQVEVAEMWRRCGNCHHSGGDLQASLLWLVRCLVGLLLVFFSRFLIVYDLKLSCRSEKVIISLCWVSQPNASVSQPIGNGDEDEDEHEVADEDEAHVGEALSNLWPHLNFCWRQVAISSLELRLNCQRSAFDFYDVLICCTLQ